MNFLAEVLSSVEKVELQEVNEKMPELKLKIDRVKSHITEFMEVIYLTYSERPRENKKLLAEIKTMEKEINVLKHNIESIRNKQLAEATSEMEKHISTLLTINFTLNIVSRLGELNEKLSLFDDLLKNSEYFSCMKLIFELEPLPTQLMEDGQLLFLDEIQMDIGLKKHTLLNKLSIVFSDNIVVKCIDENHTILKITKDTSALQNALKALYLNDSVISFLSSFVSSLWKYFIIPAVDNTIRLKEDEDECFNILEITIDSSNTKSMYSFVFSNVKTILQFLRAHFDFELAENISIMKLIGDDIRDNLAELVIKHCLEDTIPSASEDLPSYKIVIQETEQFEKTLQLYDIFAADSTSLKEYTNNVDIHFINKKCKEYLLECDVIMKKDLHDMKEVGTPYNPDNALDFLENDLPHCCVSKSSIEIIKYLENIMLKATSASEVCAVRLLHTVKNIIIKYGHLVPEYHSKLLQTIPQQVALFQNNCFYISYELTTWKEKFCTKLSPKLETAHCNFTEEAYQIKQKGIDCFTNYVCKTKDSLVIIGIEGPMLEEISPDTEKSIRQCMRQQELLKTVWHKVLSYPLYNRTIGSILNTMCSTLINSVMCIEDISSKAAEQLVDVFKIVLNRGPKLFTDPKEINLFVPSWYKFNELNFVLAASLVDINDRWADGKGPLAMQFKATEMKSLIRALFQNTDRRAAVLSKIQD